MPRYLVERLFGDASAYPAGPEANEYCRLVIDRNSDEAVTWLHSYVSLDRRRSYCVYEAPSPEAIRRSAARNALPVERITEIRVLDPYFDR